VFLDDDVLPARDWRDALTNDLASLRPDVAGSQGQLDVPQPEHRRPTDWERNVAGLSQARWATADMAYRRDTLQLVNGFDERFARAYREDSDLALRVMSTGRRLVVGERCTTHPVRNAPWWISLPLQEGNADDVVMDALHGPAWRAEAGAPRGRFRWHVLTTAAAAIASVGFVASVPAVAIWAAVLWLALTGLFALQRIKPGPRTGPEVAAMIATSTAVPIAATWYHLKGRLRVVGSPPQVHRIRSPLAVLFDRDGTLIRDVPYNGNPDAVEPMPGAREALQRVRDAGIAIGIVSNQSGVGRGLITPAQLSRVNKRVEEIVGPVDVWVVCHHDTVDQCDCRKPAPGLIVAAAEHLGLTALDCAVVGDIGSDIDAARRAGARSILVPTPSTRPEEVVAADELAVDLDDAVGRLLGGR
jgi:HAD superfamily hydrolase (TIGR01662 family)